MTLIYLTLEQAIEIHRRTVEVSGGGLLGARDIGILDSVLEHIQNDAYYPLFEDKLTHLFFSACNFHSFVDGNKRIAMSLCAQLLLLNGYLYCASTFFQQMENISYHVAARRIDKELLHDIITAVINEDDENEALKLEILNAISSDPSR